MKPKTQFAANMNTFDALPIGGTFKLVAQGSYRILEVYSKVDSERVEASDGRIWPLAFTANNVIFSASGAYTTGQYDLASKYYGMTNEQARAALRGKF